MRLVVPFSIFIHPFWGAIASLIADNLDVVLIDLFNLRKFKNYTKIDKLLDYYYLFFELVVALSWANLSARLIAITLFTVRTLGMLLYLKGYSRKVFVVFPNVFEHFFLAYVFAIYAFGIELSLTWQIILLSILIPTKFYQEYILHYAQHHPWEYLKSKFKSQHK